jgi:soluble lytic murein transglycosylase-like protein
MTARVLISFIIISLAMLVVPSDVKAEAVATATIKELIVKHSNDLGVDPAIALSIAKAESGYCHDKRSKHGAIGVFQLMPSTAKRLGYNPYSVNDNIRGGITYYKMMYKMFGKMDLAIAAYNAGPGNVKKYNGIPPFKETKKFVASIMTNYNSLKANPNSMVATKQDSPLKNINYETPDIKELDFEQDDFDFRYEHEAVLKAYLKHQGV